MSAQSSPDIENIRRQVLATIHAHWKLFLFQGVLMMVLGFFAVALPNVTTLAVEIMVGWLFIIGGAFRTVSILRSHKLPGFWWSLLMGVLAIVLGLILLFRPLEGVLTLTIILVAFFIVGGVAAVLIALEFRRHLRNWGWTLFSGIVDLILAYVILWGWPSTAAWVIGLLVGINMLFYGLSLIMTSVAARSMGSA